MKPTKLKTIHSCKAQSEWYIFHNMPSDAVKHNSMLHKYHVEKMASKESKKLFTINGSWNNYAFTHKVSWSKKKQGSIKIH